MTHPVSIARRIASVIASVIALSSAALTLAAPAAAHDLTVEIVDAPNAGGAVITQLYGSGPGWLNDAKQLKGDRTLAAQRVTIVFRDLPAGRYALAAFHDANDNGTLDKNFIGMPSEAYGFSRDARGTLGPPGFEDAAFELGSDTRITVRLR